ncbi:ferritin-like domain-containing protein [Ferruginibacter albus]|uniref:ferritin-like domain-containing protein n=1 Tax=Ferruginibacter albus TaxID=2875540 RepID=UPI001CC54177|nr:ferritin-like domain-containing protein [Ferruginibacter albus]UAY51274.1 ferritin-like domain-containing protein [Ferruginibacter albus]
MKENRNRDEVGIINETLSTSLNRKNFLKYSAFTATALVIGLEACSKDDNNTPANAIDVGSGDIGILNFAYALEQLEAAFYVKVNASFYSGITNEEKQILSDIMGHEVAHRDFFKAALGANAIPALTVDFSSVNFNNRASVLGTAKALEDTGVSAYNGAGQYIASAAYLTLAGKIVSVEARHAAAIRDLLNPKSADFAGDDVVAASTGLDFSRTPNAGNPSIVATANTFLTTKISATKLP